MKRLLLLASITHKYGAMELEAHAVEFLITLVTLTTVRDFFGPHTPDTGESLHARIDSSGTTKLAPADALELAISAQCDKISDIFRAVIDEDIWEGRMHPYDAFCAAQRIGDDSLMGAACYMLMRAHSDVLLLPDMPKLSLPQRVAIERGRAFFYREWDRISAEWSDGTLVRTKVGQSWDRHGGEFEELSLGATWKQFALDKVPSYDVLRRISITSDIVSEHFACSSRHYGNSCPDCSRELEKWFNNLASNYLLALGAIFSVRERSLPFMA